MVKECEYCGHIYCSHSEIEERVITDPESGQDFIRAICADTDCREWRGDRPIAATGR